MQRPTPLAAAVLMALFLAQACSVHYIAAPPMPERGTTPVTSAPRTPGPGETVVTLDVVGEPARVDRIMGRQQFDGSMGAWPVGNRAGAYNIAPSLQTMPLCRAPCTVVLPQGDHELLFTGLDPASTRTSTAIVRIGAEPVLVRHVLGLRTDHPGRLVASVLLGGLAGVGLMTGGALAVIGQDRHPGQADMAAAAWTTAGVGVLAGLAAVWLGLGSASEVQPGTTAVFPLAETPAGP